MNKDFGTVNRMSTDILWKVIVTLLGKPNAETLARQARLIEETKTHLGPDNCHTFDGIKWSDHGGTNEQSLASYLVEFGKLFEEKVTMLLDRVGSC